jgi:tetratricopeptide (TPR) repeat protein
MNFKTIKNTLILLAIFCQVAHSQSNNKSDVLKVLNDYDAAVSKGDIEKIKSLWMHDEGIYWNTIGRNYSTYSKGWKQIEKRLDKIELNDPTDSLISHGNFNFIRFGEEYAIVENEMKFYSTTTNSVYRLNKIQILAKIQKEWKMISRSITDLDSYKNTMENAEDKINQLGYNFLQQKEIDKAIEVFKLNVKYFPEHWNGYDSLGEAYAKKGLKKLAIENYQKSVALNPNNKNAIEVLGKLKNNSN